MKKTLLILAVLLLSISTYAQIGVRENCTYRGANLDSVYINVNWKIEKSLNMTVYLDCYANESYYTDSINNANQIIEVDNVPRVFTIDVSSYTALKVVQVNDNLLTFIRNKLIALNPTWSADNIYIVE